MDQGGLPNFWMVGLQMAVVLCLLLALLYGAMHLMKRFSVRVRPASGASIDILCARHVGPKKQVMLIEVQGRRVLIGVGPDTVTGLAEWSAESLDFAQRLEAEEQNAEAAPGREEEGGA